jgi:NADPH-dependent glutamate synthase beta subunit-like oxidoreductase/CO/xanthine dehydrogenase FAD-binding subunit
VLKVRKFKYVEPSSIDEASSILRKYEKAKIIAGGTDILGWMKDDALPVYPEILVNIKKIQGLEYVKEEHGLCGSMLRIGALTKLIDIAENKVIQTKYTALAEAAGRVASPHIREMGTIGGNICQDIRCWYYRYPNNWFPCLRKGGETCWAIIGDSRWYHSAFGCTVMANVTPCTKNCPLNIYIPVYLSYVKEGRLREAATTLLRFNPFPSITGRVCPHSCEEKCNRRLIDQTVSISSIERFVGDYILEKAHDIIEPPKIDTGKSVAIVGSGPAGLSAAYFSRIFGHRVVIFEKQEEPGGLLRYGIPPFRLPKAIVKRQIEILEKLLGINFQLGKTLNKSDVERLMNDFDTVLLACGAWIEARMGIQGEELLNSGLDFLTNINKGVREVPGNNVAIIGGGNVAIDVARVLLRLGAKPTIIYRRTEGEMPALKEGVREAKDEGVVFEFLTQPIKAERKNGKIALTCVRMRLGPPDETGRPRPIPIEGSEFTVMFDAVIKAVGELPDTSLIPSDFLDEMNKLKGIGASVWHLGKNLFVAGDLATGPSIVAKATAAGRQASMLMDEYMMGRKRNDVFEEQLRLERISVEYLKKISKVKAPLTPVMERIKSLDIEDVGTLSMEDAIEEARRCFPCGCIATHPSDCVPALIALGARVVTNKRVILVEDLFKVDCLKTTILDHDEIITEIQIPEPRPGTKSKFLKFSLRKAIDFALVQCAIMIRLERGVITDARICLNGIAPTPYRAVEAENYLLGKPLDEYVVEETSKIAVKSSAPLPMTEYKVQIAKALVKKALLALR